MFYMLIVNSVMDVWHGESGQQKPGSSFNLAASESGGPQTYCGPWTEHLQKSYERNWFRSLPISPKASHPWSCKEDSQVPSEVKNRVERTKQADASNLFTHRFWAP